MMGEDESVSYSAKVYYKHGHGKNPVIVRSDADIDALVDALLAESFFNSMATLCVAERAVNAAGFPGHEFGIAVDNESGLGGLWYSGNGGSWFSLGVRSERDEVFYYYMGHDRGFPIDSEIPVDLVRQAAKEFLASGGERPTCVQWQPYES